MLLEKLLLMKYNVFRSHYGQRDGQSHRVPMGHANRGHREYSILSVADISHAGTQKAINQERREKGL